MENINNFKKIQEEDEAEYIRLHEKKVNTNLMGTIGFFRLVGDLVDVFMPRVVDVFVMAMGGNRGEESSRGSRPAPPSQPGFTDPGKISPSAPDNKQR